MVFKVSQRTTLGLILSYHSYNMYIYSPTGVQPTSSGSVDKPERMLTDTWWKFMERRDGKRMALYVGDPEQLWKLKTTLGVLGDAWFVHCSVGPATPTSQWTGFPHHLAWYSTMWVMYKEKVQDLTNLIFWVSFGEHVISRRLGLGILGCLSARKLLGCWNRKAATCS